MRAYLWLETTVGVDKAEETQLSGKKRITPCHFAVYSKKRPKLHKLLPTPFLSFSFFNKTKKEKKKNKKFKFAAFDFLNLSGVHNLSPSPHSASHIYSY